MTTKQYAKIAKELLPHLPGFVVEKKMVFKPPVGDFLRGLYFENTSDANYFHFSMFFLPVFVPTECVYFNYGKRIGNALNWRADNPNLLSDLNEAIRVEAIPFFNHVSTLAGVVNYLKTFVESSGPRVNSHTLEALAYSLIKNEEYSAALKVLAKLVEITDKDTIPWVLEQKARAQLVEVKLFKKPEDALAQLETWTNETINKLGLEKYR
jgi:hypothetical protein